MNGEVFQRAKEERLLLKILQNRRHSWIGNTVRHNEFLVNILEGAISGKNGRGKTSTTTLRASRQEHRSWQLYSNEKNGLQQFQIESCQPIKILKDKKKNPYSDTAFHVQDMEKKLQRYILKYCMCWRDLQLYFQVLFVIRLKTTYFFHSFSTTLSSLTLDIVHFGKQC